MLFPSKDECTHQENPPSALDAVYNPVLYKNTPVYEMIATYLQDRRTDCQMRAFTSDNPFEHSGMKERPVEEGRVGCLWD